MKQDYVSMTTEQRVLLPDCQIETRTVEWHAMDYVYLRPDVCRFSLTLGVRRGLGHGLWRVGGDPRAVETGHCGAVEAETGVHVRLAPGTRRSILCSVDATRFRRLAGVTSGWFEPRFLTKLARDDGGPRRALTVMAEELATPRFARDIALEGQSLILFSEIGRILAGATETERVGRLSDTQLALLREMIDATLAEGLSIATLAAALGMSRRHLARSFRSTCGQTLRGYVEDARLQRIVELLTGTALPLKVIAAKVGLSSANYLSTAFRRRSGLTPGAYRQLATEQRSLHSIKPMATH